MYQGLYDITCLTTWIGEASESRDEDLGKGPMIKMGLYLKTLERDR